jgi:GNAT superfamily N-acetyltransferase
MAKKVPPAEIKTCHCKFSSREEEREARREILRAYGHDLPEATIEEMVSDALWEYWTTKCSCDNPKELLAVGHWKPTDWYLCTVRGLAVKKEVRGKGLGREVAAEVVENAEKTRTPEGYHRCLVLGADVTYDNEPSIKSLKRQEFQTVDEFCWGKGQKPAKILHMVRFKPEDHQCPAP